MVSERGTQLKIASYVTTGFAVLIILALFLFLSSKQDDLVTESVIETPTIIITPTETPKLITIEYQLTTENALSSQVHLWYVNGEGSQNITKHLSNSSPFSEAIQVPLGGHVEISGFLVNDENGELTCQILADSLLIDKNTNFGTGVGVHCVGTALTQ